MQLWQGTACAHWAYSRGTVGTFERTSQEFKRYIGPRLRIVVQLLTKKQQAEIGACEHCGSGENLESVHVLGRDRTEIIDLLLGTR
jgi:hypothetical protein